MTPIDPPNVLMVITVADLNDPDNNSTIVGRVVRAVNSGPDVDVFYLEDPARSDDSVLKVTLDARDGHEAEARE